MDYKLKCICIDDELPALSLLEDYCIRHPALSWAASFSDPLSALEFLEKKPVDLAIMDIQMPGLNGVDFFKKINTSTLGIFISANPAFAQQAYEIDVIDFILKPVTYSRFEKAISKALDFYKIKISSNNSYLTVKHNYLSRKIPFSDIIFIEGAGEYIKIVTAQKTYMQLMRLKDFEDNFQNQGFVRVHKSFIVPKANIASCSFNSLTLNTGQKLPVGRAYNQALK